MDPFVSTEHKTAQNRTPARLSRGRHNEEQALADTAAQRWQWSARLQSGGRRGRGRERARVGAGRRQLVVVEQRARHRVHDAGHAAARSQSPEPGCTRGTVRDGLRRGRSPSLLRAATLTAGAGRCGSVAGALREGCSRGQLRCNGRYAGCNVATRTVVNCLAAHLSLADSRIGIGLQSCRAAGMWRVPQPLIRL